MKLVRADAELWMLSAANGDPLMLFGSSAEHLMLWPTHHIQRHPVAFARWCRKNVGEFKGKRAVLQHELCARTLRWVEWLGLKVESNRIVI